jgi:hypothetical protein
MDEEKNDDVKRFLLDLHIRCEKEIYDYQMRWKPKTKTEEKDEELWI